MPSEAMFGAGCFWGVEVAFSAIDGVLGTAVGYAGGAALSPSYEDVCDGHSGHAEVVHLTFDAQRVSYRQLVDVFFRMHDPTQLNRQGPDVGDQYRSVVFVYDDAQRAHAEQAREELTESGAHARPIVTQIEFAPTFHLAEEYHQQYLAKRGQSSCRINDSTT